MNIQQFKDISLNGLWKQNPGLVQLLGMCPTMAVTTSVVNGASLGLITAFVMTLSGTAIAPIRSLVPNEIRIPVYILIIAALVTIAQLLMNAYVHQLYLVLGIFIPLIVTNCIVLARVEAFASKNPILPSALDGLFMGLGATLVLTALGFPLITIALQLTDKLDEYLSTADLVALVKATPFVLWYNEERRRLRRDAQLLANWAKLWGITAAATLKRAQAAYVAWQNYTSSRELPDWQEAQLNRARYSPVQMLYSAASDGRQAAKRASSKAASTLSAADRLSSVESRDLALLGAAFESFICQEFTPDLSSVDSVAMPFLTWVDR